MFGNESVGVTVHISGSLIKDSDEEKLLGVTISKKLIPKVMSVAFVRKCQKLHMEEPQLELTMTTFIMSHFSYCPLVWMLHYRASNNKIQGRQRWGAGGQLPPSPSPIGGRRGKNCPSY